MKNRFSSKLVLVMLFACFALQACGVKGELRLPSKQNDQETTQNPPESSVVTEQ